MMKRTRLHNSWILGTALLLVLCLLAGTFTPVKTSAAKMDLVYLPFQIDGGEVVQIAAYEANYSNNLYVSFRSLARALSGTAAQFQFYNDDEGYYQIETGVPYDPAMEPKQEPEDSEEPADEAAGAEEEAAARDLTPAQTTWLERANNWLFVNGRSVNYFNYADYSIEDLFVSLLDCGMILDLNITLQDGIYQIHTGSGFQVDLEKLNQEGYFDYLHGAALGDASTGELFLSCHGEASVPIASTTKLMTYLVAKRLVEIGRISEDDIVTISANAARLSVADDGVIVLSEGQQTTVKELMEAMLIISSNECALALAEYCAGSEAEFVRMMNAMAAKLGLASAVFYNPHGLPSFLSGEVTAMVENHMSAEDLFRLARTVVLKYPEIEEITAIREIWLEGLWATVRNTNQLLDNLPDVFGLKTGTTDAAGKCLVSARKVAIDGREHIILAVVLGAEFDSDRFEVSELLQRGAVGYLAPSEAPSEETP